MDEQVKLLTTVKWAEYKYFSVVFLLTSSIPEKENHNGFMEEIGFFHPNLKKLEEIPKMFGNDWISRQNY